MTATSCHRHLALLCLAAATTRRGVARRPRGAGGAERSASPVASPVAAPLVPVSVAAVR